jgi:LemA protein
MSPSTVFLLVLIVAVFFSVVLIVLMVKAFDMLATMRGNCKNSFVPLHVQLVKRRKMIESLIEDSKDYLIANGKQALLETLKRACNATANAEARANNSQSSGNIARRLGPMEDAMVYALCRLVESLQSIDDPEASVWAERLQQALVDTDPLIEEASKGFNSSLEDFNKARAAFPFVLVAGLLGFKRAEPIVFKRVCR